MTASPQSCQPEGDGPRCDCIEKVNEHLKGHNTEINVPFWSQSGILAPFVETRKVDTSKRGKPISMMASHCPFCGVSLSLDKSGGAT